MSGDLARSLVDAAAEAAITRAAQLSKEIANSKGQNPYVGDKFERAVMESAVAAALETLAAALGKDPVELMDLRESRPPGAGVKPDECFSVGWGQLRETRPRLNVRKGMLTRPRTPTPCPAAGAHVGRVGASGGANTSALRGGRRRFPMAGDNSENLQATLNKADTMIRNGKDATQARKDFADQLRKAGFTDAQAAVFEGRSGAS